MNLKTIICLYLLLSLLTASSFAVADEAKTEPAKVESKTDSTKVNIEVIASNLDHPCGVAVQPGSGDVFVSNTGAGQVVKFAPSKSVDAAPVVTGYSTAAPGQINNPITYIGPLGLAFLDRNTLLVGGGEVKNGQQTISVFELPNATAKGVDNGKADPSANATPLELKAAKKQLGPIPAADNSPPGSGNFYGMAVSWFAPNAVYATNRGSNDRGWILRSEIRNKNALDDLKPYISTKIENRTAAPAAIAVQPRGLLVVGHMGTLDQPHDSWLSFYNPKTGGLLSNMPIHLHDIVGLAYGPDSGLLYAVDFAAANSADGGVYRLDAATIDGRSGVKAIKIAAVDRPTALAFAPDGTLYVTAFGPGEEAKPADAKSADAKTTDGKSSEAKLSKSETRTKNSKDAAADATKPAVKSETAKVGQLIKITGGL